MMERIHILQIQILLFQIHLVWEQFLISIILKHQYIVPLLVSLALGYYLKDKFKRSWTKSLFKGPRRNIFLLRDCQKIFGDNHFPSKIHRNIFFCVENFERGVNSGIDLLEFLKSIFVLNNFSQCFCTQLWLQPIKHYNILKFSLEVQNVL